MQESKQEVTKFIALVKRQIIFQVYPVVIRSDNGRTSDKALGHRDPGNGWPGASAVEPLVI